MAGSMAGRTVVVTGATNGIGQAAATALAQGGAQVTIVGRNGEKTARVVAAIKQQSGSDKVDSLLADLSRPAAVKQLASAIKARHHQLDVLLNNAGCYYGSRLATADGLELTFALNHLGYFVLTTELLDLLQASDGARVVSVSSGASRGGKLVWDDLQFERRRYQGFAAYGATKLMNIMFTRELARRLQDTPVVANCLHPGVVATGFGQNSASPIMTVFTRVAGLFMLSPEQGADTAVWLASSAAGGKVTGKYFVKRRERGFNRAALDDAACARLWQESERIVAQVTGTAAA